MQEVEILIISNKFDFGTDYICLELEKRNSSYLRINRDEFVRYEVVLDVKRLELLVTMDGKQYRVSERGLKSVYYRAPIYLRDIYKPNIAMEEQLSRTQWTAFIRNLTILEKTKWVNHPAATFVAENKLLQLKYANELGLLLPDTYVTNTNKLPLDSNGLYIAKSLDTAVLRVDDREAFIYSNVVSADEINNASLDLSPVVIQNYIGTASYKIDVRLTIIEEELFAVRIMKNGKGINGDWRREKDNIEYREFRLPDDIQSKCKSLLRRLGLNFGAIDLIESNGQFYFLEVNPTGEWAWLVEGANLPIHERICDSLAG
jgi:glutathione synthase/RimK-type ligase-like ATP-grasp enzyme